MDDGEARERDQGASVETRFTPILGHVRSPDRTALERHIVARSQPMGSVG